MVHEPKCLFISCSVLDFERSLLRKTHPIKKQVHKESWYYLFYIE